MSVTSIEWATHVFNPFTGCDRVSPGCAKCYAATYAARLKAMGQPKYQNDGDPKTSGPGFGFTVHRELLEHPPRFPAGARVFVNSMSDVFHEEASAFDLFSLWRVFADQPQANFLVLTKRPERMRHALRGSGAIASSMQRNFAWPLPNVWLGVSIENRRFVDRADVLRQTPAVVRFISAEPLLGALVPNVTEEARFRALDPDLADQWTPLDLTDVDWLIVGGESGAGHRRIHPEWVRDLRDACLFQGNQIRDRTGPHPGNTAFFFKQWGGHTPKAGGRELDGRTWDEFPETRVAEPTYGVGWPE